MERKTPKGKNILFLGGGAGFFTKSLVYPYCREKAALEWTSDYLDYASAFKNRQGNDRERGISPHTMKYGKYKNNPYLFGPCEVKIQ